MASNVDVTVPVAGSDVTSPVIRQNFVVIKAEIEQLQGGEATLPEPPGPGTWGRQTGNAWARAVALAGDTMTGPLVMPNSINGSLGLLFGANAPDYGISSFGTTMN